MNKTKIVATVGPATSSPDTLLALARAGVNVFRINFSHGKYDQVIPVIEAVRAINKEHNMNLALLGDLQGPKLRVGEVAEGTLLKPGQPFSFTNNPCVGDATRAFMTYERFPRDVKVGETILVDDGKLLFKVVSTNQKDEVVTEVIQGGPLKSKKGVNLPNTKVSLPCLTEKDLEDLDFALSHDLEWIGLSFVRAAADVRELRAIIAERETKSRIVSKIEKPEAVADFDAIIAETDAVMVARGDLGVEIPMEQVPLIQKRIVSKCLLAAKPVIIATQMMESMITNMSPTRAEVNDVANAVLDGADAVMLSGETSVGAYPVETVKAMSSIIQQVENAGLAALTLEDHPPQAVDERYVTNSICYNAAKIADQVKASAILTMTHSGYTALQISSHRPESNIFVFTSNRSILNQVSLIWGVRGFFYDRLTSTDDTFEDIKQIIVDGGLVEKGDFIIKIASMPIKELGMTNMLKISQV